MPYQQPSPVHRNASFVQIRNLLLVRHSSISNGHWTSWFKNILFIPKFASVREGRTRKATKYVPVPLVYYTGIINMTSQRRKRLYIWPRHWCVPIPSKTVTGIYQPITARQQIAHISLCTTNWSQPKVSVYQVHLLECCSASDHRHIHQHATLYQCVFLYLWMRDSKSWMNCGRDEALRKIELDFGWVFAVAEDGLWKS